MDAEEAIVVLKARDPRLLIKLAELCAAVDAANLADDPVSAWTSIEAALVDLIRITGADEELLKHQIEEAHEAIAATDVRVTREDLDNADLRFDDGGVAFIETAFARHLITLPIGIAGTKAGLAAVGSLMSAEEGFDPWLFSRTKRPGGDTSRAAGIERLVVNGVLAQAARLMIHFDLPRRTAIKRALSKNGIDGSADKAKSISELLRQRTSRRATNDKPADPLHLYFEDRLRHERHLKFDRQCARRKVV
jgi:hypothetical protein